MKRVLAILLLILSAAPAFAGEDRASGRFSELAKHSEKIFIGSIKNILAEEAIKIVSLEVIEGWAGERAGEVVKLFVFDQVIHYGDPTLSEEGTKFLFYLRESPLTSPYTNYGSDLYVPTGGESSIIPLQGSEGEEIGRAAKLYLDPNAVPLEVLEVHLNSTSERVRSNALSSMLSLPSNVLRAEAPKLAAYLLREKNQSLCSEALVALAKARNPESLEALVNFAIEREETKGLIPLVAHALNRIDPAGAVKKIASKQFFQKPKRESRALSLLSRIDAPEAIGEVLARSGKSSGSKDIPRAFSSVQKIQENWELRSFLLQGSLEEKKAAAYTLFRWGSREDRLFVRDLLEEEEDEPFKKFLRKLIKKPYLSFHELR